MSDVATTRADLPLSIGEPVDEASRLFALKDVFSELQLTLEGAPEGRDIPSIVFDRLLWTVDKKRRPRPTHGLRSIPFLTANVRMGCPSLSLPAGPPEELGSCAPAGEKASMLREPGKYFVCDHCWARKGQFAIPEIAIAQAARAHFIQQRLDSDGTGKTLALDLVAAISDFARGCTLGQAEGGRATRTHLELGVWDDGAITVPQRTTKGGELYKVDAMKTNLDDFSSLGIIEQLRPRNGEIAGFFRIHDTGELTIGPMKTWTAYLSAWTHAAKALPRVLFWLPTRAWRLPGMKEALATAAKKASNLIIRPSAFSVNDPIPTVRGLSAGTNVTTPAMTDDQILYQRVVDKRGRQGLTCPSEALTLHPTTGSSTRPGSCMAAKCRACWGLPSTPIAYPYR